jgi:predicted GH43/DUF377 family glycosyl hydrolase
MKLQRHLDNPILLPDLTSEWECANVFNPSVIHHNGLFHMHYRAQGLDWISRIGYAVSEDGFSFNRLRDPVMSPIDHLDSRGVEDPRVTDIDGHFYMCYTAYGNDYLGEGESTHLGGGIVPMIARSDNLISWERVGPLVVGENNKDHVLFPRKIGSRFAAFHRPSPNIWIAYSDHLSTWSKEEMAIVMRPRPDNDWDSLSIGSNGVPIETEMGWLHFYHGYDDDHLYRLGVCMLDIDDPTRVIARPKEPIFEPAEIWEVKGDVNQVVFSCANLIVDGEVYVYYGGGDHVIGLATCQLDDLLQFVVNG